MKEILKMINGEYMIIESSQEDIHNETIELFLKMKPYLNEGDSFTKALKKVGKNPSTKAGWYKRIHQYVLSQGYKIRGNKL